MRAGFERFYDLDYDGALRIFDGVSQAHPTDPIAWDYVLIGVIFRELYHQDLLDTTYYAHDSFLSTKREVDVLPATRAQIESLTDKVIALSDERIKRNPNDKDAEMAIGIQQFAVASLPRFVRMMVGIMGVGGSKQRGLAMLRDAATHGVITAVDARTILSLFLRHDGQYPSALEVERGLATEFPHDYLFRLEVANLLKDEGHGPEAIEAY